MIVGSKKIGWKKGGVIAVVVVAVGAGSVAAYWSAGGGGSARTSSVSAVALTVSPASSSPDLFPGFTLGDLHLEVTNPNPYPVTLTGFDVTGVTSSAPVACPVSNISVVDTSPIVVALAADSVDEPVSITDVVSMDLTAPDGCQGVSFDVTVTVSGTQS